MTLSISQSAHDELMDEMIAIEPTYHPDPEDDRDFMGSFPPLLGQGYWRTILQRRGYANDLRDGLSVTLGHLQLHDRVLSAQPEGSEDYLEFHLHVSGTHQNDDDWLGAGEYCVYGSGAMPKAPFELLDRDPFLEVQVLIRADLLRSFIGDSDGELTAALQPWVRSPDRWRSLSARESRYAYFGTATPAMQLAARQMLRCNFQGVSKRLFLEGKSLELLGLAAAVEMARTESERLPIPLDLLDRIHYARDILHQQLDSPPSLGGLAKLVSLNEYSLKQGFRQVFGTTVFGYLHDYRMEQARHTLELGDWKVGEVARMVGYTNLPAFSRAFSKRFNITPSDCLRKKSV